MIGVSAVLVGCSFEASVGFDDGAGEGATPGAAVASGTVSAHDVRVGDCYKDDGLGGEGKDTFSVEAVPCGEPHDNEVYATFDLADGDFPGADEVFRLGLAGCVERFADFTSGDEYPGGQAVQDEAIRLCRDAFADYVGIDYEHSALEFVYLWPEELMWNADVRVVRCAVYDPEAPLTDSVKGTGR